MPTTVSGLTFYEEEFETGMYQGLTQAVDGFNASSGGAIQLTVGARKGRNPKHTFFQSPAGLIQRRDPTSAGTLVPVVMGNAEKRTIKIFSAAPMHWRSQDWEDQGMSDAMGSNLFGIAYGEALAQQYMNSAVSALVGAIAEIGATATEDVSGTGTFDYGVLNTALGKFGDRRPAIRTLVAYSKPLTDLLGQAFTSQQVAFQLGTATIYNGSLPTIGLQVVNTDAPPLFINNTGTDHYWTLALQQGAVRLATGPTRTVFGLVTGTVGATPENQTWLLSVEYSFEIEVMGVSYTGGSVAVNPNDAALADAANWTDVTNSSVKHGPGIAIKSQ